MRENPPILRHFGSAIARLRWVPLGSAGGFSGSSVWRGDECDAPLFALKAWPKEMTAQRLAHIHAWMQQAEHLPFVPRVIPTANGSTMVTEAARTWDITSWKPGLADFHANPTSVRLENACAALAKLHRAWRPKQPVLQQCPAVQRRLEVLDLPTTPARFELGRHALELTVRLAQPARVALRAWLTRLLPVQPCLCDVWHDHVLFTGDEVTGLIDYGAMKIDHVSVDLARMLGDLVGNDDASFDNGLDAYRGAGGEREAPAELIRLLDVTGVICGVIIWMRRFASAEANASAIKRFQKLVQRLESIRL